MFLPRFRCRPEHQQPSAFAAELAFCGQLSCCSCSMSLLKRREQRYLGGREAVLLTSTSSRLQRTVAACLPACSPSPSRAHVRCRLVFASGDRCAGVYEGPTHRQVPGRLKHLSLPFASRNLITPSPALQTLAASSLHRPHPTQSCWLPELLSSGLVRRAEAPNDGVESCCESPFGS